MVDYTLPTVLSHAGTESTSAQTDTVTCNMPATRPSGCFLIACAMFHSTLSSPTPSATGWTYYSRAGNTTIDTWFAWLYREADGTEGSTVDITMPRNGDVSWSNCHIFAISDVDKDDPIDGSNPYSTTTSTTATGTRSVTTSHDNNLALGYAGKRYGSASWGTLTSNGHTLVDTITNAGQNDSQSCKVFTKDMATAGSTSSAEYVSGFSVPAIRNTIVLNGAEVKRRIFIT